ncbi:hypothetical protein HDU96_005276, partial [Phlyctochytrium bullatum]
MSPRKGVMDSKETPEKVRAPLGVVSRPILVGSSYGMPQTMRPNRRKPSEDAVVTGAVPGAPQNGLEAMMPSRRIQAQ